MTTATSHLCIEHPEGKAWRDGPVRECAYHGRSLRNAQRVRMGQKERRGIDQAAGKIGTDRSDTHGYIDGGEGWPTKR